MRYLTTLALMICAGGAPTPLLAQGTFLKKPTPKPITTPTAKPKTKFTTAVIFRTANSKTKFPTNHTKGHNFPPPEKGRQNHALTASKTKAPLPVAPQPVDHFPEQIYAVATCQASLGDLLNSRTPDGTISDQRIAGTGPVYKFSPAVSYNGWMIIGVYVDSFHFEFGREINIYVTAPESELLALAEANPDFPRKKGSLKWRYEGPVSLNNYAVPRFMGIPLEIPERDIQLMRLKTGYRQVSGLTLYGNGISVV